MAWVMLVGMGYDTNMAVTAHRVQDRTFTRSADKLVDPSECLVELPLQILNCHLFMMHSVLMPSPLHQAPAHELPLL